MVDKIACPKCTKPVSILIFSCPFCGSSLKGVTGEPVNEADQTPPNKKDIEALKALAEFSVSNENYLNSKKIAPPIKVTSPISAFESYFMPVHLDGPFRVVEWVLAVLASPIILFTTCVSVLMVKKWGRIPVIDVGLASLIAYIITSNMVNRMYYYIFLVSIVSLILKLVVGYVARVRSL
ncbi:MAG: hypothetical protein KAI43_04240 [Candidatus Aureabacteria bacterium]|nr:hypothetical protein [Candidatus Auribacterota bacterium]